MYLFHIVMGLKWEHTIWSIIHMNNSIKTVINKPIPDDCEWRFRV